MSLVKLNSIDAKRKTNWTKCCLCQQDTEENLVLPKRKLNKTNAGYSNLANRKEQFKTFMEGLKNHNESAFYKAIKRNPVALFKPKA